MGGHQINGENLAIVNDILVVVRNFKQTNESQIRRKANIGSATKIKYVTLLEKLGLLMKQEKMSKTRVSTTFFITDKGRKFIEYYNYLQTMLKE